MKRLAAVLLGFSLAAFGACLPYVASAASDAAKLDASEMAVATATVNSVNVPERLLTIKDSSGNMQTISVSPEVRNLEQLKKGDKISIRYKRAVAAEVKPPGTGMTGVETKEKAQRSQPGERPGGMVEAEVRTTIKVTAVDTKRNTLTFIGPKGMKRTIFVKNEDARAYLKKLKPGDEVEVAYTEALVVDVAPARS